MASLNGNVNFNANLSATGTTQVLALPIISNSFYNDVQECVATATGVSLPAAPILGQSYKIRNNGSISTSLGINLLIYPPIGGTIESQVINTPFALNVGSTASFIAINALKWNLDAISVPPILHVAHADQAGAAMTLNTQGGQFNHQFAPQTTGALVVNLPTAIGNDGYKFTFSLTGLAGETITFTPVAGLTVGAFLNVPVAGGTVVGLAVAANKATCGFAAAAGLGTLLTMQSDGTNWISNGTAPIAASFI